MKLWIVITGTSYISSARLILVLAPANAHFNMHQSLHTSSSYVDVDLYMEV